jgi:predicted Zn finger-like uncharacterized protein
MIITCPTCETRFNVDSGHLLPNGRTVKCAKCGHLWTERPPSDITRRVDAPAITIDDLPETGADVDDVPDLFERPRRRSPSAPSPAGCEGRRSPIAQAIGWSVLVIVVVGVLGGSILARETVVAWWPPSAALFELAGLSVETVGEGLEIRNITSSQKIEDDKPTLVVAGEVINVSGRPIDVPNMRGSLLDVRQREVYAWVITPKQRRLAPGQAMAFDTSVREPPANARRIAVAFFKEKGG